MTMVGRADVIRRGAELTFPSESQREGHKCLETLTFSLLKVIVLILLYLSSYVEKLRCWKIPPIFFFFWTAVSSMGGVNIFLSAFATYVVRFYCNSVYEICCWACVRFIGLAAAITELHLRK
jgi:hypothetical protein